MPILYKNTAFTFDVALVDHSTKMLRSNPTIAAGDVTVFGDGSSLGNPTTAPTVSGYWVTIALAASETNYGRVRVQFADQTNPPEWDPWGGEFFPEADLTAARVGYLDRLDTAVSGVAAAVWGIGTRTLTSYGTLVADIWANGTRTLTSFGTLAQDIWDKATSALTTPGSIGKLLVTNIDAAISSIAAGELTAASVWAYATRTLTQTAAQIATVLAGSTIMVQRGDSLSVSLTGITAYTGYSKLWFTVKNHAQNNDRQSAAQILLSAPTDLSDGLQVIAGQSATNTDGSLTADDPALGDITIALKPAATRLLQPGPYYYDVQALIGTTVTTLATGSLTVVADITRAIS